MRLFVLALLLLLSFRAPATAADYAYNPPFIITLNAKGEIRDAEKTGCSFGQICWAWKVVDSHPGIIQIAASWGRDYQLRKSGEIWHRRTLMKDKDRSWRLIDNNPATADIVAGSETFYQRHKNGRIWQFTDQYCDAAGCRGWKLLDANPRTRTIVVGGANLYQMHDDGRIWRYTGKPCGASGCPGWDLLDRDPRSRMIAASGDRLYQLRSDGRIWRWNGDPCGEQFCGWTQIGADKKHTRIFAAGSRIYAATGHPRLRILNNIHPVCKGDTCTGWVNIDASPVLALVNHPWGTAVLRADNTVWQPAKAVCENKKCWEMLDVSNTVVAIAAHN